MKTAQPSPQYSQCTIEIFSRPKYVKRYIQQTKSTRQYYGIGDNTQVIRIINELLKNNLNRIQSVETNVHYPTLGKSCN